MQGEERAHPCIVIVVAADRVTRVFPGSQNRPPQGVQTDMATQEMDWTYPVGTGDSGIFEIGRRLAQALGRAPDATLFMYDPRAMLRTTRDIERASIGGRLLVGFQAAAKFDVEAERYRALLAAGTQVVAWAAGSPADDLGLDGLDYRALPADTRRLQNQWFLVSDSPEPLAFVSYELGDANTFGIGGAASPGKRFVGFVSDDADVVDLLIRILLPIGAPPPPAVQVPPSASAVELVEASDGLLDEPASDAGAGAVVVAVGRGADRQAFITALALARREDRDLVIVDRAAEGFASPYGDWRGDDADRPSPDRLFDITTARREGRGAVITYLEAAAAAGVVAGGWFPTASGAEGLAEAGRRFSGAIVVVPSDVRRPSLAERLRGMAADRLGPAIGLPMVVAGEA